MPTKAAVEMARGRKPVFKAGALRFARDPGLLCIPVPAFPGAGACPACTFFATLLLLAALADFEAAAGCPAKDANGTIVSKIPGNFGSWGSFAVNKALPFSAAPGARRGTATFAYYNLTAAKRCGGPLFPWGMIRCLCRLQPYEWAVHGNWPISRDNFFWPVPPARA